MMIITPLLVLFAPTPIPIVALLGTNAGMWLYLFLYVGVFLIVFGIMRVVSIKKIAASVPDHATTPGKTPFEIKEELPENSSIPPPPFGNNTVPQLSNKNDVSISQDMSNNDKEIPSTLPRDRIVEAKFEEANDDGDQDYTSYDAINPDLNLEEIEAEKTTELETIESESPTGAESQDVVNTEVASTATPQVMESSEIEVNPVTEDNPYKDGTGTYVDYYDPATTNEEGENLLTCKKCGYSVYLNWGTCPRCDTKIDDERGEPVKPEPQDTLPFKTENADSELFECSSCGYMLYKEWGMCPVCNTPIVEEDNNDGNKGSNKEDQIPDPVIIQSSTSEINDEISNNDHIEPLIPPSEPPTDNSFLHEEKNTISMENLKLDEIRSSLTRDIDSLKGQEEKAKKRNCPRCKMIITDASMERCPGCGFLL